MWLLENIKTHTYSHLQKKSESLKLGRGFIAIIAIYVCVCLGSP